MIYIWRYGVGAGLARSLVTFTAAAGYPPGQYLMIFFGVQPESSHFAAQIKTAPQENVVNRKIATAQQNIEIILCFVVIASMLLSALGPTSGAAAAGTGPGAAHDANLLRLPPV